MTVQIFYTGTLITPDGSDSFDGEPCEEGTGATVTDGWVSPDWSRKDVYDNREDVAPDTYTPDDGPLIEWIAERLGTRLIGIEDNGGDVRTFYSSDADTDPYTGVSLRMAAHVDAPANIVRAAVMHIEHLERERRAWYARYVEGR